MNLKSISDDSLHQQNIQSAKEEREMLTRVLHQLRETEKRKLYCKYKCKSLFAYAVKYLKYSNDQADRRIKAMHLLRDLPEVESKINSGALNLTNLALAHRLFVVQKKSGKVTSKQTKIEILESLENQTTRDAERIVYKIEPTLKPNKAALDFNSIEDDGLREKLLRVKGLFAHVDPYMSLSELLHKLCDQELLKKTKTLSRAPKIDSKAEIEREVWRRDRSKCVNCESTYALQVEHKIPKAAGGPYTLENLCLLCRPCNLRRAIEFYGMPKMENYLKSPSESYLSVSQSWRLNCTG